MGPASPSLRLDCVSGRGSPSTALFKFWNLQSSGNLWRPLVTDHLHVVHYDGSGITRNRELPVPHKIPSYCILIKSILELVYGSELMILGWGVECLG